MTPKALLVFNPNAGADDLDVTEVSDRAKEALTAVELDVYLTSGSGDETALKKKLRSTQYSLILIAGGDGTVKLAAACAGGNCPMAILPLGSANGLAKCLGINTLDEALEALAEGKIARMDGVMIGDHLCLHLADFGFNANLINRFEERDSRGMIAYIRSSFTEVFTTKVSNFVLEANGEKFEIEAHMLVIANGDRYGTGAVINPEGEMCDGWFEVIAVQVQDADDLIQLGKGLISGEKVQGKAFRTWSLKQCKIRNLSEAKFQIDGELMGNPSEIIVNIEPGIFRFVVGREFQRTNADASAENLDT